MSKAATDFEKIINADRARKKHEALAARIFDKDRRASAPPKTGPGGSLANRAGVKKRLSSQHTAARPPPGDINGSWTHDLHGTHSIPTGPSNSRRSNNNAASGAGSLASRITVPGAIAPSARRQRRAAQVAQALIKTELQPSSAPRGPQSNRLAAPVAASAPARGISIRGLAGPYAVMAQNFAPGTTAADIESAMTPVGGLVTSCRLLKTSPIVIAELVFESREGAERVIETFNNQTADGRVLHIYPKVGGFTASPQPASRSNDNVVDGSMGFDEPMEVDGGAVQQAGGRKNGGGQLYSDKLVSNRGGGGGGGGRGRRGGGRGGAGR